MKEKPGTVAYSHNPITWEMEAGEVGSMVILWLPGVGIKASLGHMRLREGDGRYGGTHLQRQPSGRWVWVAILPLHGETLLGTEKHSLSDKQKWSSEKTNGDQKQMKFENFFYFTHRLAMQHRGDPATGVLAQSLLLGAQF